MSCAGRGLAQEASARRSVFLANTTKRASVIGCWSGEVSIDLGQLWSSAGHEKLSEKDKNEGPIVKLRTKNISEISINEQVSYRGRTWLDRFTDKLDSTEFSYYGIGLEMKTAVQRRILILREMGVDPMDPARAKKLDSIEKKELSDRVSQSGLQHKTLHSGEQINGIMREIKMAGGNKYAMVETNSKEFSLVPWHKDFVPHIGKQVELINNAGRYMARGISKSLGR